VEGDIGRHPLIFFLLSPRLEERAYLRQLVGCSQQKLTLLTPFPSHAPFRSFYVPSLLTAHLPSMDLIYLGSITSRCPRGEKTCRVYPSPAFLLLKVAPPRSSSERPSKFLFIGFVPCQGSALLCRRRAFFDPGPFISLRKRRLFLAEKVARSFHFPFL